MSLRVMVEPGLGYMGILSHCVGVKSCIGWSMSWAMAVSVTVPLYAPVGLVMSLVAARYMLVCSVLGSMLLVLVSFIVWWVLVLCGK